MAFSEKGEDGGGLEDAGESEGCDGGKEVRCVRKLMVRVGNGDRVNGGYYGGKEG